MAWNNINTPEEIDPGRLTESRDIKKQVERIIKTPRTRLSDCTRLVFLGDENFGWADIDAVPEAHPIYPCPPMSRGSYILNLSLGFSRLYTMKLKIWEGCTINDLLRQVSKKYTELWMNPRTEFSGVEMNLDNYFIYSVCLKKDGTGWVDIELI